MSSPSVVEVWDQQRQIAEDGLTGLAGTYPEIGLSPERVEAPEVGDVAAIGRFLQHTDPVTRERLLFGLRGRPALPTALVAEAARLQLAGLVQSSDTDAWRGWSSDHFTSPLLAPDGDAALALLSVGELRRSGEQSPADPPGAWFSVGSAGVLDRPAALHVHFAAGMEPVEAAAMVQRVPAGDRAAIVSVLPSRAPGAQYGYTEFKQDLLRELSVMYLRHGRIGESDETPVELSVSGDEHTNPLLRVYLPEVNRHAQSLGYTTAEQILLPPMLQPPSPPRGGTGRRWAATAPPTLGTPRTGPPPRRESGPGAGPVSR